MTVVAIRRDGKKAVMSCDSQTSYGELYKHVKSRKQIKGSEKIFTENGMTIGMAGSVKTKILYQIFCKNHCPKEANVESVIAFLLEFQVYLKKHNDKLELTDNMILFTFKDKIFFCSGILVEEIDEYWAIGSGMFIALGTLFNGGSTENAVAAAKEFDGWCSGETLTKEIKL